MKASVSEDGKLFEKVLVANRGEIATRVMRTCRRLGIATVAVHSDVDASSEFVAMADEAVALSGNRVQDCYLDLEKIVAAVKQTGADAVHPGYGMLSENPKLAEAIGALGVTFIGPSADALRALGDKITARRLAEAAGLSPPPGSEGTVDASDVPALMAIAERVGYPVMVKAAGGGGGIGMQRADDAKQLEPAVAACVSRGQAAFGDARVYLEHAIERARHIEVQVARDRHGASIVLGDRECSVQRRHQKILEECPSPASFLTPSLRGALCRGARELLQQVDYVGVATVEFLADCDGEKPKMYFLEVNARIQVEHPVTELVFGLDLIELQLQLAGGAALPERVVSAAPRGHAIEVRIYAEDPARGYLPQPGTLVKLSWPDDDGVRVDAAYRQGETISPYYDPLIAKLICHAPDRSGALSRLREALAATRLELSSQKGPRTSNLQFLRALLRSTALAQGDYDTAILVREPPLG